MDKDPKQQTVAQFLFAQCSESLLKELAGEQEYWSNVDNFVENNRDRMVGDLSFGQRDWLIKIKDRLIEETSRTH